MLATSSNHPQIGSLNVQFTGEFWEGGGSEVTAPSAGFEIKVEIFDWSDFD